jgi:hypothetical protein
MTDQAEKRFDEHRRGLVASATINESSRLNPMTPNGDGSIHRKAFAACGERGERVRAERIGNI